MDELMEYAPKYIKQNNIDIFDLTKEQFPKVTSTINKAHFISAREKFFENIDILKKDKKIKNTLELELFTDSNDFLNLTKSESEDWFIVSSLSSITDNSNSLVEFVVDDKNFIVKKSIKNKCPRCWKYKAEAEDRLCTRCEDVLNG
jgi:isoleucyl-tRNA synthetase